MSQRADARQGLLFTAAGRVVCTTAWAVLADLGAPVASTLLAGFVEVGAGLDQPDAQVPAHLSPSPAATPVTRHRNQALTVDYPQLAYRAHTDTDHLTTTAPSAPNHVNDQPTTTINHVHDQLTTTATTTTDSTATTAHSTATNHHQNRPRHWHPAVPATRATLPSTGEGAGVAPC